MKCYWAIKQSKVSNTNPQKSKNSSASTKNSTTNGYNESAQWSIMKMVSHHKWCEQPNNTWQTLQQVTLAQLVLEDCSFNQEWPALVSWAILFKAKGGWELYFFYGGGMWELVILSLVFWFFSHFWQHFQIAAYSSTLTVFPRQLWFFSFEPKKKPHCVLVLYLSKLYFFPRS